jgi:prepilin-type N-terminal cleavage/methylation domain-containing protein
MLKGDRKMMKKKDGFTLIELVMVIILIGILAAVALPNFINLGSQADDAASDGVIGGLKSAVMIYYASTAVGGTPTYPGNPFNSLGQQPNYTATPPSVCADLTTGQWGIDDAASPTKVFYRRRSDSVCEHWTYGGVASGAFGTRVNPAVVP